MQFDIFFIYFCVEILKNEIKKITFHSEISMRFLNKYCISKQNLIKLPFLSNNIYNYIFLKYFIKSRRKAFKRDKL